LNGFWVWQEKSIRPLDVFILGPTKQTTFINIKTRRKGTKKLMQLFFLNVHVHCMGMYATKGVVVALNVMLTKHDLML
jgi:hypothetical protein